MLRGRLDGRKLRLQEIGNELSVNEKRGLAEPSITRFGDRFFLTVRHDDRGYVSSSKDGLHFAPLQPWLWDDGTELGNYNTQQHWVTHPKGLYLVYTRKGAGNDHVFRHRAPLFIAKVDPSTLRVIRATEKVLVPQRGKNPRRLTPRECAKLMGYPDRMKIVCSDTRAYKQFGNSVAVPVVTAICKRVVAAMALEAAKPAPKPIAQLHLLPVPARTTGVRALAVAAR